MNVLPVETDIETLLGQSLEITVSVLDRSERPVDVTAATIDFDIASSSTATPTDSLSTTTNSNKIIATLSTSKSLSLGAGTFYYAVWVTFSGESTPVARGTLTITDSTRA